MVRKISSFVTKRSFAPRVACSCAISRISDFKRLYISSEPVHLFLSSNLKHSSIEIDAKQLRRLHTASGGDTCRCVPEQWVVDRRTLRHHCVGVRRHETMLKALPHAEGRQPKGRRVVYRAAENTPTPSAICRHPHRLQYVEGYLWAYPERYAGKGSYSTDNKNRNVISMIFGKAL